MGQIGKELDAGLKQGDLVWGQVEQVVDDGVDLSLDSGDFGG